METRKFRVHTCIQTNEGQITSKCRCRKYVTREEADKLKDDGVAANIITGVNIVEIKERCPICDASPSLQKSCKMCDKTGEVLGKTIQCEYGDDIYMRPVLRTPRTATVEKNHIEYAYVKGDRDAAKRIELYHHLDQLSLAKLGAQLRDPQTNEILFEGTSEPSDNSEKEQGRHYDYGRPILTWPSSKGTTSTSWSQYNNRVAWADKNKDISKK
jgi:hypothetical protein